MTTTYKKLTWDSYKIQVESAVRDGNGATISTTYATKTEVTTGLGTKLDTSVAASTYATQTALTDGLATKADKATSLAGYGITDGVTTNTAQTISAQKTFNSAPKAVGAIMEQATPYIDFVPTGDPSNPTRIIDVETDFRILKKTGYLTVNDGYVTAATRAYNSANTTDIVTIGSLAANPSVVHTTGNETINGVKKFNSDVRNKTALLSGYTYSGSYTVETRFPEFQDANGALRGFWQMDATGTEARYVFNIRYDANTSAELIFAMNRSTGVAHLYITDANGTRMIA